MARRIVWKKGKVHSRKLPSGKKQKGHWSYPNGNKKGRKWKRA